MSPSRATGLALATLLLAAAARAEPAVPGAWLAGAQREIAAREYRASRNAAGLQAPNRAHGLRTYFEPTGIRVHDRTDPGGPELLAFSVSGVGRGEELAAVAPGAVVSEAARVEIRRPGLVEWYVNSPAGLEQGFTLDERPAGESALVIELALSGAAASLRGDAIALVTATGRRLRYDRLEAADARGRPFPARLEVSAPGRVRIVVEDEGAAYPVTIDPLLTQSADTQLVAGQDDAHFGWSVGLAGDVNGDGSDDVIVGAYLYDAGDTDEGAAFVFLGDPSGVTSGEATSAATQLESNQAGARFGYGATGAGDVNGDGYADVIVGAYRYAAGQAQEGAAFVFLGGIGGIPSGNPSTAAAQLESDQEIAQLGFGLGAAGDVNGDGYADVIVGAHGYDAPDVEEGAAFVFRGGSTGIAGCVPGTPPRCGPGAATRLESDQSGAELGVSVAGAGDVNGDGYADVIAGAWHYDAGQNDEGAAFVFLGGPGGVAGGGPDDAVAQIESNQANAVLGWSVAGIGDANGDGYADVIAGAHAYTAGQATEGAAFVFAGSAAGLAGCVPGPPALCSPATATRQLEGDQVGAGLGLSVAGAGDVNGDGYADVIVGAPFYTLVEVAEGAAFVFLGSATGIVGTSPATAASQLASNQASSQFGRSVAGAGDVNGDGYADVLVGAPVYNAGEGADEGAAFVYQGGAEGVRHGNPGTAAAQIESNQASAQLGYSVSSAGDVNGDGYSDVIVGAPYYDAGQNDEGAAFVLLGGSAGIASGNPASAATRLQSDQVDAFFGWSAASAGDVNGDGYGDVVVGAPGYDAGQSEEGAAFVFLGSGAGIADASAASAATRLESDQVNAQMGWSVAPAGDVNGDGYADVIVGVPFFAGAEANEGGAFVFLGSSSGIANATIAAAATRLESDQATAFFGTSAASAGDVNGDGYADVIVGAYSYDSGQSNEGAAFLFHGSASGIANANPATAATRLEANLVDAFLGYSVASAGDVNGDGYADVIIGAQFYDAGQVGEGAAFVFLGSASGIANGSPASAATQIEANQTDARLGWSVASAGDVNGDGYADVIVGAPYYNPVNGQAYVFHGSASGIASGSPASAAATLDELQGSAYLGWSVASAGDVNGDGYADVIVGAASYDGGQSDEGAAFVFLGGGDGDGRPVRARQLRGGGSTTLVEPWGKSYHEDEFQVRMQATHPAGRGRVKLEVEVCPPGVGFSGLGCNLHLSTGWTDVTATAGGVTLTATSSGLSDDTSYRWRARVLHAPFRVTQPGITAPPNPAHGPWRRLVGQSNEGDLRVLFDLDGDGVPEVMDTDDDGDGLADAVETDTGTFVSPANTGSDPLDADSDDDGLPDGVEVLSVVTDPNDPDHDNDGRCDGSGTGGGQCVAGDNCPAVANPGQANGDALPAGDACQCGDLDSDGTVDGADVLLAREHVVGATPSVPGFDPDRCNVVGPRGAGGGDDCDVADVAVLRRVAAGDPATVEDSCHAYAGP